MVYSSVIPVIIAALRKERDALREKLKGFLGLQSTSSGEAI